MKIIITNYPAFYKINLYNEIAMKIPILVVFIKQKKNNRNSDFYKGNMNFKYVFLKGNRIQRIIQVIKLLKQNRFDEIIVGGWDYFEYWISIIFSNKSNNSVVVESSYNESSVSGIKGLIKRLFISRISTTYVSGKKHIDLVNHLGYKMKLVITKGVGIFNYRDQPLYVPRLKVQYFLYVGRLVEVKNMKYLIHKFNSHPEYKLDIIGFGSQETELKKMAKSNIKFLGHIDNKELYKYYQKTDVFILPSKSEPWGLVVEEALNNGTPVMLSNMVGCAEEILDGQNGVMFSLEKDDFEERLAEICNIDRYNSMRKHISKMNFEEIQKKQVECYLD